MFMGLEPSRQQRRMHNASGGRRPAQADQSHARCTAQLRRSAKAVAPEQQPSHLGALLWDTWRTEVSTLRPLPSDDLQGGREQQGGGGVGARRMPLTSDDLASVEPGRGEHWAVMQCSCKAVCAMLGMAGGQASNRR